MDNNYLIEEYKNSLNELERKALIIAETNLESYTSFSGFSGHTSAWQEKEISLNSYRTVNSNHYIYFASYNATGFRGDLSVDYVQICEETPSYGG